MAELEITGVGRTSDGIYIELSDGSSLMFTLAQLRSLEPKQVARPEDEEPIGGDWAIRHRHEGEWSLTSTADADSRKEEKAILQAWVGTLHAIEAEMDRPRSTESVREGLLRERSKRVKQPLGRTWDGNPNGL